MSTSCSPTVCQALAPLLPWCALGPGRTAPRLARPCVAVPAGRVSAWPACGRVAFAVGGLTTPSPLRRTAAGPCVPCRDTLRCLRSACDAPASPALPRVPSHERMASPDARPRLLAPAHRQPSAWRQRRAASTQCGARANSAVCAPRQAWRRGGVGRVPLRALRRCRYCCCRCARAPPATASTWATACSAAALLSSSSTPVRAPALDDDTVAPPHRATRTKRAGPSGAASTRGMLLRCRGRRCVAFVH